MVDLKALGSLDLRDSEGNVASSVLAQPQLTALLVYLAQSRPGTFHRRDTLLGLMWPETPEQQARHSLNQKLYALRKAFGEDVPKSRGKDEVGIAVDRLRFDVRDFRSAIRDGRWEAALQLYQGHFLEGFYVSSAPGLERWIDEERGVLKRMAVDAASTLFDLARTRGDLTAAEHWARRALDIAPFKEAALRGLIEVLHERGDRTRAIELYEEFEQRFEAEYALEPSAETRELVEELRWSRGPAPKSRPRAAERVTGDGTSQRIEVEPRESPALPRPGTGVGGMMAGLGIALMGVAAAALAILPSQRSTSAVTARSLGRVVAVVPIIVTGSVPEEYGDLAAALTGELTARLGRTPGLLTIPSTAIEPYAREGISPIEIGRLLDASVVVEASLDWQGGGTRAAARVVDVDTGEVLWEIAHLHGHEELLSAQRDITVGVAAALGVRPPADLDWPTLPAENELTAWAYVQRAQDVRSSALVNQNGYRRTDHEQVEALLGRAIELAPDFAPAYAVRALASRQRWYENRAQRNWIDSAMVAAEHAVTLDPDHYLSQLALARALGTANAGRAELYSPAMARRRFEAALRAIQLNPSDPQLFGLIGGEDRGIGRALVWDEWNRLIRRNFSGLYYRRSHWFWILGDYEAALESHARMRELDPERTPLLTRVRVAEIHLSRGDYGEARRVIESARADYQGNPLVQAVSTYVELAEGEYEAAERFVMEVLDRDPPIDVINGVNFHPQTALAYVYLKTDRVTEGTQLARALARVKLQVVETGAGYTARYDLARLYSMLGDLDNAVLWMERAIAQGWTFYYTEMGPQDPMLENMRDDPRFIELMDGLREDLDAELEWARSILAIPESERFAVMIADAEAHLEAMWTAEVAGGN